MKKWFIALMCASTFLLAQNALAAIVFKRFAHCDDGLVTVKTCECHAELLGGRREGISDSDGEHARVERVRCSQQRLHAHRWRAG